MTEPEPDRSIWPAALIITGVVAVLIVVFVAVYPDDGSDNPKVDRSSQVTRPHIIARPEDGVPPSEPGDPGGWEQLALFGVIVAGLGTVGLLVWRASKKARNKSLGRAGGPG